MQYQEYIQRVQKTSKLIKEARFQEAVDSFYQLYLSDISEIDRAEICANLAVVYDRMGNTEDALAWYEKGVSCEQNYCRYDVTEKKAQYLSLLGHNDQAVLIYESLIQQPFVSEVEKGRLHKAIKGLLGKVTRSWQ
jgi:tetratricopeptide (TPR) repeat protein